MVVCEAHNGRSRGVVGDQLARGPISGVVFFGCLGLSWTFKRSTELAGQSDAVSEVRIRARGKEWPIKCFSVTRLQIVKLRPS